MKEPRTDGVEFPYKHGNAYISLWEILGILKCPQSLIWSVLSCDATGSPLDCPIVTAFCQHVAAQQNGLKISWKSLGKLEKIIHQFIWMTLIGVQSEKHLISYQDPLDMVQSCDVVIQMVDGSLWNIFSRDKDFLRVIQASFPQARWIDREFCRIGE